MTASQVASRGATCAHARLRNKTPAVHCSCKPASLADSRSHPGPCHHTREPPGRYPGLSRPPVRLRPARLNQPVPPRIQRGCPATALSLVVVHPSARRGWALNAVEVGHVVVVRLG